jgi:hypothetical protein
MYRVVRTGKDIARLSRLVTLCRLCANAIVRLKGMAMVKCASSCAKTLFRASALSDFGKADASSLLSHA